MSQSAESRKIALNLSGANPIVNIFMSSEAYSCCWDLSLRGSDQLCSDTVSLLCAFLKKQKHHPGSQTEKKFSPMKAFFRDKMSYSESQTLICNMSPLLFIIHYLPIWMNHHPSRTPQLNLWNQFVIHILQFFFGQICLSVATSR